MSVITINRFRRKIATVLLILICFESFFPAQALALTSGPAQPEFSGFEPIGTSKMVDPFTGDFSYNIPLFELPGPDGGYPFNLSYHSGITMDQEASWVGLGWSLSNGAITRNMRGLPDEFAGDTVVREVDMKPDITWAFTPAYQFEILGADKEKLDAAKDAAKSNPPGSVAAAVGEANYTFYKNKSRPSLSLKATVTNNNYRGIGFSFGADYSVPINHSKHSLDLGLGVSSIDGANLTSGYSYMDKWTGSAAGVSFDINSREGFRDINLSASYKLSNKCESKVTKELRLGGGSSFSFAKEAYTPKVDLEFRGRNYSFDAKVGLGSHNNRGLKGTVNYSKNELAKRIYKAPAFGFFNLRKRADDGNDNTLLDFNREKDGTIRRTTTNLATPIGTADIYSVSGQGIGGSYMAQRSDVGILTDPNMKSANFGGAVGLEYNTGLTGFEIGANFGSNWSKSESTKWAVDDNLKDYEFNQKATNNDFEPFYLKSASEMTAEPLANYEAMNWDKAMALKKDGQNYFGAIVGQDGTAKNIPNNGKRTSRKPRASSIQFVTNADLMKSNGELFDEFKIEYYDSPTNPYDCSSTKGKKVLKRDAKAFPKHHAGMVALQPNGMRYNYALPVANLKHEDYTFSYGKTDKDAKKVNVVLDQYGQIDYKVSKFTGTNAALQVGTSDDFYEKNALPQYNHSYLLTSILGTDYVDADNIPGPSDGDYGYWVKFNYVKTADATNPYKWREPFVGANFIRGQRSVDNDNKASFTYGEREQYYLATAETRTHVAKFILKERNDGRGADSRFQNDFVGNDANKTNRSYALDKIELYSKLDESKPLQTVNFAYSNNLCPKTVNTKGATGDKTGKLTLTSLWFTYENNSRGQTTPYRFDYREDVTKVSATNPVYSLNNPEYDNFKYDRWGNYKELGNGNGENLDFPYTYQNDYQLITTGINPDPQIVTKGNRDKWASAWNLKTIQMPSGATIDVDYESDDYAYVQDRTAMKMYKIQGMGSASNTSTLNKNDAAINASFRKILFNLDDNNITTTAELINYISDLHNIGKYTDDGSTITFAVGERPQIYFKTLMTLQAPGTPFQEYIQGYANVEEVGFTSDKKYGYIKLEAVDLGNNNGIHPFTAAAWQVMKMEYPDKIKTSYDISDSDKKSDGWKAMSNFFRNFGEITSFYKSLYTSCFDKDYGTIVDLSKSVIRLNCPNKIKYGGGSRVKQITLNDKWDATATATYGNVYDYTTQENGKTISSGVATNEPNIGYDECALRYSKLFKDYKRFYGMPIGTAENLTYEYPINESYLPAASVGYSKVTVKSLASDIAKRASPLPVDLSTSFGTTGSVVQEFYTAKDYPVLFEETVIDKDAQSFIIPLFVVNYNTEKYSGSQGYAITMNDMHGKARSVTSYNQTGTKITETVYKYKDGDQVVQSISGKNTKKTLDNKVDILVSNKSVADGANYKAEIESRELGVDREFFMDMRESKQNSRNANLGINVFFQGPLFAGFSFFPQVSITEKRVRTAVTNKIVRRSGILVQVDNYDGTSHLTTSNKVFDPLTGEPVLSTVNNSFNNFVYNFQTPARFDYESMGAAYENWGLSLSSVTINIAPAPAPIGVYDATFPLAMSSKLNEGDEFIVKSGNAKTKATLISKLGSNTFRFSFDETLTIVNAKADFFLWRSGKRNQVSASPNSVVALKDPTIGRTKPATSVSVSTNYPGGSESVNIDYYKIDKVLNANATTFSEAWSLSGTNNIDAINPFKTGERGIWRPYQSYVFVKKRETDAAGNINLSDNGYYNEMPLFDFKNPFFYKKEYGMNGTWQTNNPFNRWRISNEITQYGKNGSEIENRDILGKNSSVLYGYKDNLAVAVAGNAQQNEIGFEGFEEFRSTITPRSGNLDFAVPPVSTPIPIYYTSESYNVVGGCKIVNGAMQVWIDKPAKNVMRKPSKVTLQLSDIQGNTVVCSSSNVIDFTKDATTPKVFNSGDLTKIQLGSLSGNVSNTSILSGKVSLIYENQPDNSGKSLQIDYTNAHTGRSSLRVSGTVQYNQSGINFQDGKPYFASAWVKVVDGTGKPIQSYTYGTDGKIKIYLKGNTTAIGQCVPVGEIIEGWQKVEGTITPNLATVISTNPKAEWILEFNGGVGATYFDDLRIFPKDAEMQTYVYDPKDYKLRATLDNNNYATLYSYDESGKLFLVKKETTRGIKTIQETRAFVKANN